ncbi:MAG: O-antigen ligase family protein [Candidatus Omnitrophica bacterium]|nr:O-antigen ligase family protein [Candidatus Omnitrophota bacterium]
MIAITFLDRAIFVLLCLLVFFLPATNAFVEVASALAILAFLIKQFLLGPAALKRLPGKMVLIPALLFFVWSGLSIVWSQFPLLSLKGFLGKSLQAAFLFIISYETLSSGKRYWILIAVFMVSAGIVSLDGLWQAYSGFDIFVRAPFSDGRVMASFRHPNDFGAYLILAILPVIVLTITAGVRSFTDYSLKNAMLFFGGFLFVGVASTALGLTYSRGAWFGMVVAAIILIAHNRRLWPAVLAFTSLFILIFQPLLLKIRDVSFVADTVGGQSSFGVFNGNGRLVFWRDALKVIADNPIFGTGLNSYTMVIKKYVPMWAIYPHNCYLQMGAELGLVGLALFLWFMIALMIKMSSGIGRLPKEPERWLLTAFFAGWCGFLVHSGLDTSLYSSQLTAIFWVVTGAMAAFGKQISCRQV